MLHRGSGRGYQLALWLQEGSNRYEKSQRGWGAPPVWKPVASHMGRGADWRVAVSGWGICGGSRQD
jgi:hypothetical protein